MSAISDYLNDPLKTYAEGVKIYIRHRGTDKYSKFFQLVTDVEPKDIHFKLLIERLIVVRRQDISKNIPEPAIKQSKVELLSSKPIKIEPLRPPGVRLTDNEDIIHIGSAPDPVQKAYRENKELMRQIAGEHGALKSATEDSARMAHLNKAIELQSQKDANWKLIDEWLKTNKPTEKQQETAKQTELNNEKRKETLKKNIRRAQSELKEKAHILTNGQKVSRKEKLAVWKQELKDLK